MWKVPMYETTKLTVELRDLIESGVKLWDFEYPSYYKGEAKTEFEKKVVDHFYFRQIGQETIGRFLHQFRAKIREIMPYYIQMYKSVEVMEGIEDPFGNVDITESFTQTKTGTSCGSSESSSSSEGNATKTGSENGSQKFSDTPQGSISNLDNYLTNATVNQSSVSDSENQSSSASGTSQSSGETSEELTHTFTKKGNQGVNTYAHDMIEFRQSFINVDMMIINELNPLFLGVY